MITIDLKNGYTIGFNQKFDMFQPFIAHGEDRKEVPLLLEAGQLERVKEILTKINVSDMEFEAFSTVIVGGLRIAMKN